MRHQNDLPSTYFHFATFTWSSKQFIKSLSTPHFLVLAIQNTCILHFTLFTKVQLLDPIISIEKDSTHIEYTTVSLSLCMPAVVQSSTNKPIKEHYKKRKL